MPNSDEPGHPIGPWAIPTRDAKRPPPLPPRFNVKVAAVALVLLVAGGTLAGSFYTVQPTEMAGVRRLGTVLTSEPVGPGLHMKLPWIDTVDTIQTSLNVFQLNDLTVYTIDNQAVTVGIGVSYRIPRAAVLKLLYNVGRTGNVDINENIRPVLADRVLRVFSTQNTVNISANREQIASAIRKDVSDALGSIFGLEITDLQLSSITYSPSFQASVEAAVQAKNDAIRAENTVAKVRYEGEQVKVQAEAQAAARVAQANGEAEAAIVQARAQSQAAILRAQGESQAATLTGEAQAHVIQQIGAAVAANPSVVNYEQAHRWNGAMPATMLGGGTSPLTMFNVPAPVPATAQAAGKG
ncbi:MAG TPA: prohibitin family protein [Acetobacteraceae bacterium]